MCCLLGVVLAVLGLALFFIAANDTTSGQTLFICAAALFALWVVIRHPH